MIRKLLLPAMILIVSVCQGQQDPLYAQYLLNPVILNPAYAGFTYSLSMNAGYRKQWAGFDGSPATFYASAHSSFVNNRVGLGLIVQQDRIGSQKTNSIQGLYSYHLQLSGDRRISFGLQGGILAYTQDYSELTIDRNDPGFLQNVNVLNPTAGAGIIYSSAKLYAGLSVPRLFKNTVRIDNETLTYYNQHAYLMLAYNSTLSYNMKLKPFLMARAAPGSSFSVDAGVVLSANNAYSAGLFTRNLHTYGLIASVDLGNHLRFGYVFEIPVNVTSFSTGTTHELTLSMRLKWLRFHDPDRIFDF